MHAIRAIVFGGVAAAALGALAACESELTREGNPELVGRAVESPVERNSASGEMANLAAMQGVPLVEVGIPNARGQAPQVHTIADSIFQPTPAAKPPTTTTTTLPAGITVGGAASQPAATTQEAPTTRPGVIIDPILGPRE